MRRRRRHRERNGSPRLDRPRSAPAGGRSGRRPSRRTAPQRRRQRRSRRSLLKPRAPSRLTVDRCDEGDVGRRAAAQARRDVRGRAGGQCARVMLSRCLQWPVPTDPSEPTVTPSSTSRSRTGTGRSPRRRGAPRTSGRPATRSASSRPRAVPPASRRTSAGGRAPCASSAALRDRPLEPLLPHRARRSRPRGGPSQRAERVPVERRRRHRPAALLDVVGGRRPPELVAELPQLPGELLARREPPRHQTRPRASPRSRCRSARSPSAGAPATAGRPRTPSSSVSGRGAPRTPAAPRGSARRSTAAGSPPGTRRAPRGSIAVTAR